MKSRLLFGLALLGIFVLPGCGSVPKNPGALTKEQILLQPDVKDKEPAITFDKNIAEVRLAGLRALTFVGCEVKTQEPLFLSGHRPNKFGLFVGSGGETVKIFLYPETEAQTKVWVDTDLSFAGIAGQQSWNKQVVEHMSELVGNTQSQAQ